MYSTLNRRGNGRFHVVLTWNTRGVFVGCSIYYRSHKRKKKRPDVDSIFNHSIMLIELMNQKIISNKKTSSVCDTSCRSEKSANNLDI